MSLFLDEFKVNNFCNLKELNLNFSPKLNIFYGNNGEGKTNILEAIYFLNKCRPFRRKKEEELIRWNEKNFYLKGSIVNDFNTHQITIIYQNLKKEISIDNKKVDKLDKLYKLSGCVIFSPSDLHILDKSPSLRRYFLNLLISQTNENYLFHLKNYNKILNQRNKLLSKEKHFKDLEILKSLDQILVKEGVEIIKIRYEVIKELNNLVKEIYKEILPIEGIFEVKYKPSIFASELEEEFFKRLDKYKDKERQRGYTLIGPHRDDIVFTFKGVNIGNFGSQGQKRMAAIIIRFGELFYLYKKKDKFPIMLLDDLFSELDEEKRRNFVKLLDKDIQIFITTTDLRFLKEIKADDYKIFQVKNGNIIEE